MKKIWQRICCVFGYHANSVSYLKRTDQRVLIMACPHCDKVVKATRLTKRQAKDLREINRKFCRMPLRD